MEQQQQQQQQQQLKYRPLLSKQVLETCLQLATSGTEGVSAADAAAVRAAIAPFLAKIEVNITKASYESRSRAAPMSIEEKLGIAGDSKRNRNRDNRLAAFMKLTALGEDALSKEEAELAFTYRVNEGMVSEEEMEEVFNGRL